MKDAKKIQNAPNDKRNMKVYSKDLDFINKLKDKMGLKNSAELIKRIVNTIKYHKLEEEIK